MINYLKDIKKETLIGLLPDIINNNNLSIRNEFNWIFDSSLNRLTKSVYAPTGSVKAHFGEFTNLACEYFTVKNVDSLAASILDSVESIINKTLNVSSMQTVMAALTNIANSSFIDPELYDISALCNVSTLIVNHNVLNNRFVNPEFEDDTQHDFKHDAAAIVYEKNGDIYTTVYDKISILEQNTPFEIGTGVNSALLKSTGAKAIGENAVAIGHNTNANGKYSYAEGYSTTASGTASHAEGYSTIADSNYGHAEGKFNISHTNSIHTTGIGTNNKRLNAFEITTDGSIYVYDVAKWDGKTLNNSSTLQEYIKYLEARIAALESRL